MNEDYKIFELFRKQWALVSAGTLDDFNTCTVSWGSLGTMWTRNEDSGNIATIYIHPARHTLSYLKEHSIFTITFFDELYKQDLAYLGSHSGKDEDKVAHTSLHPVPIDDTVGFNEASKTFVCKKLMLQQIEKECLHEDIQNYYKSNLKSYPVDNNGDWQPHYMIIGEITQIID